MRLAFRQVAPHEQHGRARRSGKQDQSGDIGFDLVRRQQRPEEMAHEVPAEKCHGERLDTPVDEQCHANPPPVLLHPAQAEMTIGGLLATLAAHGECPLVFHYDGNAIRPGYHITEVKSGQFAALDCGGNPEAWTEIFVQLLDGHEDRAHMKAAKFAAILRKVTDHVALDLTARLTFEVSDGIRPMQLYFAGTPERSGEDLHCQLVPRPASCKPRDRWLEEQKHTSACCTPAPGGKACC